MDIFSDVPSDQPSDWARLLPRDAFHEIILVLRGALPPPLGNDPADEARRDRAAMAGVAALLPVNAAEGRLAAQFVAADAWAMDCLRLAREKRREPDIARRCVAQAMSMMREAKSSMRLLLRLRAKREKIEADEAAAGRAEHAGDDGEALPAAPVAVVVPRRPASHGDSVVRRAAGTAGPDSELDAGARKFGTVSDNATMFREVRAETNTRFGSPVGAEEATGLVPGRSGEAWG